MNHKNVFHVIVTAFLLSLMLVTSSCTKYGKYKGEDYKIAWEKINKYIIDNPSEKISFTDIKSDYILKAVIAELVRRGENPGKKCPVDTASINEEKHIVEAWDDLIRDTMYKNEFFEAFADDFDQLAQLLQDNNRTKVEAYSEIGFYLAGLKKFDEAIEIYKRGGMSEVEANKELLKPIEVSGSGGYWFFEGKEDKFVEILVKTGKTEEEAKNYVAGAIASGLIHRPGFSEPEEIEKHRKMAEEKSAIYLKDNEKRLLLLGESALRHEQFEWAADYYEKSGNKEELDKAYLKIAWEYLRRNDGLEKAAEYFGKVEDSADPKQLKEAYTELADKYRYDKDDLQKAAIYYEKAGDKETAAKLRKK